MARAKTNSEKLWIKALRYIPGGVNSPVRAFKGVGGTPIFVERGKGANIWDVDGKKYVDHVCSWGPLILGHAEKEVSARLKKVISQGTSFGIPTDRESELIVKYKLAIRYQLDFLLRFALKHASDDVIITLFGDHQAPVVTPESFGKETPVHVISRSKTVTDELCRNGFVPGLDLAGEQAVGIRHEGFLSLFMRAVNQAFGRDRNLKIEIREGGADIFSRSDDENSG